MDSLGDILKFMKDSRIVVINGKTADVLYEGPAKRVDYYISEMPVLEMYGTSDGAIGITVFPTDFIGTLGDFKN